ncbi:hypothetical protein ACODT3_35815 [Streptomyces sp. 4.24]|uniref:hypothetical protein n=1 Tax=Streptomyces tritrimontium TaxID=3406573 RepID=UPI003BB69BB2
MTNPVKLLVFLLFLAVSVIVGLGAGFLVHAEGMSPVNSLFTAFGSAGATLTLCCVVYASFRV